MKTEFEDALHGIYGEHDAENVDAAAGYQALGPLSIACFVLGIAALLTFVHWVFGVFPVASAIIGYLAIRKILVAPEVTTGASLTAAGLIMACVFSATGYGYQIYTYYTHAPDGYIELDWTDDLLANGGITQRAEELDGQLVFVRGYMQSTRYTSGLRNFTLVRSVGHCDSCQPITNPTNMLGAVLLDNKEIDYTTRRIGIGGRFHINRKDDEFTQEVPYIIEADCVR